MLGDWRREPAIARSPALLADLDDMRAEVTRCKDILSQVLLASGEVRGNAPVRTTLRTFLAGIASDPWVTTPDEGQAYFRSQIKDWGDYVRVAKIEPQG